VGPVQVTCLVGNRSSTVYNDLLRIAPLTDAMVAAFSDLAGTDAGDALAEFANQINGNARDDFDGLLWYSASWPTPSPRTKPIVSSTDIAIIAQGPEPMQPGSR
jgi:hypothetical protein